MNFSYQSSPKVISDGQKKLPSLQESLYLHNKKGNYEAIGDGFDPIDLTYMDVIGEKIIKQQKQREQEIYSILGVKNIEEFNKVYLEQKEDNELLTSNIETLLSEAAIEAFTNPSTTYRNKANESKLYNEVEKIFSDMVDKNYSPDIAEKLKAGLSAETARLMKKQQNEKRKPKMMDKYVEKLGKRMNSQWKGIILEEETAASLQGVVNKIKGKRGNVKVTGKVTNSRGKMIKADATVEINESFTFGIQSKNYNLEKGKNIDIAVNSSGSLRNFYDTIDRLKLSGVNPGIVASIEQIARYFQTPYFKYHLINQAAFIGTNKIDVTDVGKNILDFIKMCMPIFLGAQLKLEGDTINVDFFNISGKLVPVSQILENVFNGGEFAHMRASIQSNYKVPWVEMRDKKLSIPLENGEYYSSAEQKIGGHYGENLYKDIKIGKIYLKVALANI